MKKILPKVLVCLLVLALLVPAAFALGIRPAKTDMSFEPGKAVDGSFKVVNNEPEEQNLQVYIEGPASDMVAIHDDAFTLAPGEVQLVRFTVHMPESLDFSTFNIYASPIVEADAGVAAIVRISHKVNIRDLSATGAVTEEVNVTPQPVPEPPPVQEQPPQEPVAAQAQPQPQPAPQPPGQPFDFTIILLAGGALFLVGSIIAWLRSKKRKSQYSFSQVPASSHIPIIIFISALLIGAFVIGDPTGLISGDVSIEVSVNEGNVIVTIQTVSSLVFAIDTVDFGTGFVNTSGGNTACILDSEGTNDNSKCINFSTVTQGFVIENDGNNNLTVELRSNASADQFIGGNSSFNFFQFKVSQNETGSCSNLTVTSYTEVNTSSPGTLICNTGPGVIGGFDFRENNDTITVDINISIPVDATSGTKQANLIATGTTA